MQVIARSYLSMRSKVLEKSGILELLCLPQSGLCCGFRSLSFGKWVWGLPSPSGMSMGVVDALSSGASSSFVVMGGGEMKWWSCCIACLFHCFWSTTRSMPWKSGVGEKTYQASNSRTKQKQQSSGEARQGLVAFSGPDFHFPVGKLLFLVILDWNQLWWNIH